MPPLTKAEVYRFLPHAGSMCLIDEVTEWDRSTIVCRAASHRDPGNPLRRDDRLGVVAALEYAAQAMGMHAGLVAGERSADDRIGYVGAVRDVTLHVERLDDLPNGLAIEATRLVELSDSFMYRFAVTSGSQAVISGRASIFLKQTAN